MKVPAASPPTLTLHHPAHPSKTRLAQALKLQKEIYRGLQLEIEELLGPTPQAIARYARENARDFRRLPPSSSSSRLRARLQAQCQAQTHPPLSYARVLEELQAKEVIFIGDFHAFQQSQKTALRLLKDLSLTRKPTAIGLEFLGSQFQAALEDYQHDRCSLTEFLTLIDYQENWGFPYAYYEPLITWAKQQDIRLVALNMPHAPARTETDLRARDQWAAKIITHELTPKQLVRTQANQPPPHPHHEQSLLHPLHSIPMIVLYGSLHVGSAHLPKHLTQISKKLLKRPLSWASVHQDVDSLYWKLAAHGLELSTEALQLKSNVFALFPYSPNAKLHALVRWLENSASEVDPQFLSDSFSETDFPSWVRELAIRLASFFGCPPPSLDPPTLYTWENDKTLDLQHGGNPPTRLTQVQNRVIRFAVRHQHTLNLPFAGVGYLASGSLNRVAEMAALHLFHSLHPQLLQSQALSLSFHFQLLARTLGYLGSLMMNPKRKLEPPGHNQERLLALKTKKTRPLFVREAMIRGHMHRLLSGKPRANTPPQRRGRRRPVSLTHWEVARRLGATLAQDLYHQLRHDQLPQNALAQLFFAPLTPAKLEARAQKLLEFAAAPANNNAGPTTTF